MPPTFWAPIPIHHTFGRPREITESEAVKFFEGQGWAMPPNPIAFATAIAILTVIYEVREQVISVGESSDAALDVDDRMLDFINPEIESELRAHDSVLGRAIRMGGGKDFFAVQEMLSQRLRHRYPGLDPRSAVSSRCWHSQGHERLRRRGQKFQPVRRASTWGTYIIAWFVGTDDFAVRLWNKLLLPEGYRWANPAKYSDAKQRLIRSLGADAGQGVMPRDISLRPYPPLSPNASVSLASIVEAATRAELSHQP